MNKHVASVHGGKKPFICDNCDYSRFQKGHMNKHVPSVNRGKSHSYVTIVTTVVLKRVT